MLKVESDEIVAAARKNGAPVEYVLFLDEGRGFVKKENEIKGYASGVSRQPPPRVGRYNRWVIWSRHPLTK